MEAKSGNRRRSQVGPLALVVAVLGVAAWMMRDYPAPGPEPAAPAAVESFAPAVSDIEILTSVHEEMVELEANHRGHRLRLDHLVEAGLMREYPDEVRLTASRMLETSRQAQARLQEMKAAALLENGEAQRALSATLDAYILRHAAWEERALQVLGLLDAGRFTLRNYQEWTGPSLGGRTVAEGRVGEGGRSREMVAAEARAVKMEEATPAAIRQPEISLVDAYRALGHGIDDIHFYKGGLLSGPVPSRGKPGSTAG